MLILVKKEYQGLNFSLSLSEKGNSHFEVLPEGWVQVTHNSGMPVYLHKQTRVCTMAKPYFLGQGSVRVSTLQAFLSAIALTSCMHYYILVK